MRYLAVLTLALMTLPALAGAADIMRFPAKNGTVVFNHKKHEQLARKDCAACHERPGEVPGFGRAYAHKVCIGCHEPEPGRMEGPTTCEGCHTKG